MEATARLLKACRGAGGMGRLMMRVLFLAIGMLAWLTIEAAAVEPAGPLPAHNTVSEDLSDQRRSVFVRLERRLDEPDLLRLAEHIRDRSRRTFARTQVNYFLPGAPLNQGAWASVQFNPETKVMVHGLRREDEDLFLREHHADRRALLGAWLTSPPAAPGCLSIYSDRGHVYAEWRLRNGQKTLDELQDSMSKAGRRFDVQGGGFYVLARSGELEIWDKTTLIATAERIRPEHLALPVAVALGPKLPPVVTVAPSRAPPVELASPAQPEPKSPLAVAAVTPGSQAQLDVTPRPQTAALPELEYVDPKVPPKKSARTKSRTNATVSSKSARGPNKNMTPGDQIAAKLSGRL